MKFDDPMHKMSRLRSSVRAEAATNSSPDVASAGASALATLDTAMAAHEMYERLEKEKRQLDLALSEKHRQIFRQVPAEVSWRGPWSLEVDLTGDPGRKMHQLALRLIGEYKALEKRASQVAILFAQSQVSSSATYQSAMNAVAHFWNVVDPHGQANVPDRSD